MIGVIGAVVDVFGKVRIIDMEKLIQCPHCNGMADIKKSSVDFANNSIIHNYHVECTECGASTEKYDTYFGFVMNGKRFRPMTEKGAIHQAVCDWNNGIFDVQTRLAHMSNAEKILWHIENLLSDAWYGTNVSVDSMQWKTAWELRKIAENKKLLSIKSDKDYDLGEVAKVLYADSHVLELITMYLNEY